MDTQGLPAPRPLLGQGGARPRCGPSLGTPIRCSSQAGVGARSCGLGATRSSPGRRRYRSRVRRVGVEAQHPWWGPGGPPRPQGLRGWRRGCGESGRGAARSAFRPGDGFLSESGRGAAPSVTVRAHGRGAFSFPFGGFGLGVFFLLCRGRGGSGGHDHGRGPWQTRLPHGPPLTEALLEADSSSLLAGWAAFLRLRGLERVAFRRLFGGLVEESSYSSAREKRSLNLEGSGDGVRRCQGGRGHRDGRRRLTSSCGLRRSWPGRAAGPAGWGFG